MKNISLFTDGVARHLASPATFDIPSNERKQAIRIGDNAEVEIQSPNPESIAPNQRVCVEVTEIIDGKYCGYIKSFPRFAEQLAVRHRDTVSFEAKHILDIVTIEQQEKEHAEAMAKLKPINEIVELPEDPKDGVEMEAEDFEQVALSTIPEGLIVVVMGVKLPEVFIDRENDRIDALIGVSFDPEEPEEICDARAFCLAAVDVAKALIADGHPLADPQLEEGHIRATWKMRFPETTRPDLLLREIEHYWARIEEMAEASLRTG